MLSRQASNRNLGSGDHSSLNDPNDSVFSKVADMINDHFEDNFATPHMIDFFHQQFEKLDSNGDGQLGKDDLAKLYKNRATDLVSPDEDPCICDSIIEAIYKDMDYNEDGEVTFLDYAIFMTLQMKERTKLSDIDFTRAFDQADKDGDGLVTSNDIRRTFSCISIMDVEDADSIVQQYDRDGKGMLNCEEYCEFMHDQGKQTLDVLKTLGSRPQTPSDCDYPTNKITPMTSFFNIHRDQQCPTTTSRAVISYESCGYESILMNYSSRVGSSDGEGDRATNEVERWQSIIPRPDGARQRIGDLITNPDFEMACRELFESRDENHDGLLTLEDIQTWLLSRNDALSEADILVRFTEMNRSKSGRVDFNEFLVWSALTQFEFEMYDLNKCPELFKMFDRDGDGFISKEELGRTTTDEDSGASILPELSEEEKDDILQKYDFDKDGKLSYTEFMRMITDYLSKSII